MATSLFADSFQSISSYFILGPSTFYFYLSWIFTLSISMVPIILWSIYDTIAFYGSYNEWYAQAMENHDSVISLFAILRAVVALLATKVLKKEDT